MKHVRRITRMAHLFGAVSFVLVLVACTDRQDAIAPTALVDISKAQSVNATVTTSVESFDAKGGPGPLAGRTFTQKVKAVPKGPGFMLVAPDTGGSYYDDYEPLANTAPVLAVTTGNYWSNYDESVYDSQGNLIRFVATGPGDYPVTDIWTWVNGYPQVHMHNTWTGVYSGYVLSNQTVTVVRPDYSRAIGLSSTVSLGYTLVGSNSVGAKFAGFAGNALSKIGCWLAPQVAYASFPSGCGSQALVFAGETFVLGVGTVSLFPEAVTVGVLAPPVAPLMASAYLAGWGLWTKSLYDILSCIDNARGRPHRTIMLPNYYGF